jgi:hypothetical protein
MNRKGFVLAAALLVVLMIAVLVAGVFAATIEESRIAGASVGREQALSAAESALATTIGNWSDRSAQPFGVTGADLSTNTDGVMPVSLTVVRLDSTLYSIVAEARTRSSQRQAIRRIAVIVSVKIAPDHSIHVDPTPGNWWSEFL